MIKCPKCNTEIPDSLIAKHFASLGGKQAAKNMTKKQRIERARKAGKANKNKSLTRTKP